MVSKDEMIAFFRSEFPKARYVIEDFTDDSVVVRHQVGEQIYGRVERSLARP